MFKYRKYARKLADSLIKYPKQYAIAAALVGSMAFLYANKPILPRSDLEQRIFEEKQEDRTSRELHAQKKEALFQGSSTFALLLLGFFAASYTYFNIKRDKETKIQKQDAAALTPFLNKYADFESLLVKNRDLTALACYSAAYLGALELDYSLEFLDLENTKATILAFPPLVYAFARLTFWCDEFKSPKIFNKFRSLGTVYKMLANEELTNEDISELYDCYEDKADIHLSLATHAIKQDNILKGLEFFEKCAKEKTGDLPDSFEDNYYFRPVMNFILKQITKDSADIPYRFELAFNYLKAKNFTNAANTIEEIIILANYSSENKQRELLCASAIFFECLQNNSDDSLNSGLKFKNRAEKIYSGVIDDILDAANSSNFLRRLNSTESEVLEINLNNYLKGKFILERTKINKRQLKMKFEISKLIYEKIGDLNRVCRPLASTYKNDFLYASYLRTRGETLTDCLAKSTRAKNKNLILTTAQKYFSLSRTLNDENILFGLDCIDYVAVIEEKFIKRITNKSDEQIYLIKGMRHICDFLNRQKFAFIHNNLHPDNLISSEETNEIAFIDWGDAGYASPFLDLAHFLGHHSTKFQDSNIDKEDFFSDLNLDFSIDEQIELFSFCEVFKSAHLLGRSIAYNDGFKEHYKNWFINSSKNLAGQVNSKKRDDLVKMTQIVDNL